ncbi:DUF1289 domain-containing protein [Halioxenophilus aromaticivorans]|uniref:DUF1289 domain-containing protein n=1 Tax=Halioxenophilus aromaticivorans TaxID=1306992 RepID=A0AAV3TZT2_9ALTE
MAKFRSQISAADKSSQPKAVNSPCIAICALNQDDVCTGCYRTGQEIAHWGRLDNDQRRDVLALCKNRARAINPFLS